MTISAVDRGVLGAMLEHSFNLYRDLSEALSERIARVKGDDPVKDTVEALKDQRKALDTVLTIGAGLDRVSQALASGVALDVDAARAEIAERLAVWLADG